jgi:hypothetical protein
MRHNYVISIQRNKRKWQIILCFVYLENKVKDKPLIQICFIL